MGQIQPVSRRLPTPGPNSHGLRLIMEKEETHINWDDLTVLFWNIRNNSEMTLMQTKWHICFLCRWASKAFDNVKNEEDIENTIISYLVCLNIAVFKSLSHSKYFSTSSMPNMEIALPVSRPWLNDLTHWTTPSARCKTYYCTVNELHESRVGRNRKSSFNRPKARDMLARIKDGLNRHHIHVSLKNANMAYQLIFNYTTSSTWGLHFCKLKDNSKNAECKENLVFHHTLIYVHLLPCNSEKNIIRNKIMQRLFRNVMW